MHTLERVWIPDAAHEFFRLGHIRCISYFSYGCDKIYLLKSDLRKRVYFGSLSESTAHCSGKSRQKEGERAGHIVSMGRKQREVNNMLSSPLSLYSVQDLSPWNGSSHSEGDLNLDTSHPDTPNQFVSRVIQYHQVDSQGHTKEKMKDESRSFNQFKKKKSLEF